MSLFHDHLDVCAQCARDPFGLCAVGASLLKQEAFGPFVASPYHALPVSPFDRPPITLADIARGTGVVIRPSYIDERAGNLMRQLDLTTAAEAKRERKRQARLAKGGAR